MSNYDHTLTFNINSAKTTQLQTCIFSRHFRHLGPENYNELNQPLSLVRTRLVVHLNQENGSTKKTPLVRNISLVKMNQENGSAKKRGPGRLIGVILGWKSTRNVTNQSEAKGF